MKTILSLILVVSFNYAHADGHFNNTPQYGYSESYNTNTSNGTAEVAKCAAELTKKTAELKAAGLTILKVQSCSIDLGLGFNGINYVRGSIDFIR